MLPGIQKPKCLRWFTTHQKQIVTISKRKLLRLGTTPKSLKLTTKHMLNFPGAASMTGRNKFFISIFSAIAMFNHFHYRVLNLVVAIH